MSGRGIVSAPPTFTVLTLGCPHLDPKEKGRLPAPCLRVHYSCPRVYVGGWDRDQSIRCGGPVRRVCGVEWG